MFKVFRNKIGMLLATGLYDNFMLTMVMANTVLMCLNGLVDSDSTVVSTLNLAFTYIFTVDITLKLLAYGSGFFEDVMNFFDMFVVVVSPSYLTVTPSTGLFRSAPKTVPIKG